MCIVLCTSRYSITYPIPSAATTKRPSNTNILLQLSAVLCSASVLEALLLALFLASPDQENTKTPKTRSVGLWVEMFLVLQIVLS